MKIRGEVHYSSSATDIATIIDNQLYTRRPGTVTITAWCTGDAIYANAEKVNQTIEVNTQYCTFSKSILS